MDSFKVKLDVFEGPFDLLLYLVRENNVDIYDISISQITDCYLTFLAGMEIKDLGNAGDFLVMASTLVYLKSRMLLPEVPKEVEEEVEKIKNELQSRLVEYRRYKEISGKLRDRLNWQGESVPRVPYLPDPDMSYDVSVMDLISAFEAVVKEKPAPREIHREDVKIEDRMLHILDALEDMESVLFSSLFSAEQPLVYKVVTFLAILELIRISKIFVSQKKHFAEIYIFKETEDEIRNEANPEAAPAEQTVN